MHYDSCTMKECYVLRVSVGDHDEAKKLSNEGEKEIESGIEVQVVGRK
jgi:hypothetical protein